MMYSKPLLKRIPFGTSISSEIIQRINEIKIQDPTEDASVFSSIASMAVNKMMVSDSISKEEIAQVGQCLNGLISAGEGRPVKLERSTKNHYLYTYS